MEWGALLWAVFFFVLAEVLRPKPKFEGAKAAGLEDFNFPTAEEGSPVPVIWGTVQIGSPNVVWYGAYKAVPITKKVKTGLFSKKKVVVGHKYYVGMHLVLCVGEADEISYFKVDEKLAWQGSISGEDVASVVKPDLFGGNEEGGGISGTLEMQSGLPTQDANEYLASNISDADGIPAFRGVTAVVWRGGYIGTSQYIRPWRFEVKRIPTGIAIGYENINGDANPAIMIWEALSDASWGLGVSAFDIDTASFEAAAQTLYNEGFGMSYKWTRIQLIEDTVGEILRHINAVMYKSHLTGLYKLILVRDDYDVGTLKTANISNIKTLTSYSRGSWDETTNDVKTRFISRVNNYTPSVAIAQDIANYRIQGGKISATQDYNGIYNEALAAKVAQRDLHAMSYPLSKIQIECNRYAFDATPGDVFKWNWVPLGITDMVMRVIRVEFGELDKGTISIVAVQDIFSLGDAAYATPPATGWQDPIQDPSAGTEELVREMPYLGAYLDPDYGGDFTQGKFFPVAAAPAGGKTYEVWYRTGLDVYTQRYTGVTYVPRAQLDAAIDGSMTSFTVNSVDLPEVLVDLADPSLRAEAASLAIVGDELFVWDTIVNNGDGTYTLNGLWRGILDTTPQSHAIDTTVYFTGYDILGTDEIHADGATANVKYLTQTSNGVLDISLATEQTVTFAHRAIRPYPPGNIKLDGIAWPTAYNDTEITVSWSHRDRTNDTGTIVEQTDATSYGPEATTTYTIRFYAEQWDGSYVLFHTETGLSGTSFTYLEANEIADNGLGYLTPVLVVQIEAVRDGYTSWQYQERKALRTPVPNGYGAGYGEDYGQGT